MSQIVFGISTSLIKMTFGQTLKICLDVLTLTVSKRYFKAIHQIIPRIEKMTVMTFFVRQNQVGTFRIHYVSLSTTQNGL